MVACESSPIPCPHPSTLTCVSLTMETFSPRVRGGLWALKKKKKKSNYSASFILPLLETRFCSKRCTLVSLPGYSLTVNSRGRLTDKNGRQTGPCAWSQSFTMNAKNIAKARACAVQTSTGTTRGRRRRLGTAPSSRSKKKFRNTCCVCFHRITNFSAEKQA